FEEERRQIAPKTNPEGENWIPGDGPSQVLRWATKSLAKAGTLSVVGVYPPQDRSFPIGLAMNRNLTINMGNCHHRRYIPHLVQLTQSGTIDPTEILSQKTPLASALEAYKAFDRREAGWMKVELEVAAAV
ncbi:MAG TPA: glutathione-dependent formaldehyde dehydrogenase, partial [Planctomycetota bacterium]|nr:glutathione-dependent formaldehyde dehydrogenase [Planctomycetota bacterium]